MIPPAEEHHPASSRYSPTRTGRRLARGHKISLGDASHLDDDLGFGGAHCERLEGLVVGCPKARGRIPALDRGEARLPARIVATRGHVLEARRVLVDERVEEAHRPLASGEPNTVQPCEHASGDGARCRSASDTLKRAASGNAIWRLC